ncbi:6-bladed beta-propeller, partial [candidate division KSB1 bacterium]
MKVRSVVVLLLIVVLLFSCGSDKTVEYAVESNVIEKAFTLELEFGVDNLPDEFLIVRPQGIALTNSGDIIVLDESRLKVFDNNGNPKLIFGRQGQGPGEFESP